MPGVFKLEPVQTGGQLFDFPSFAENLQKEATPTFKTFQDRVANKQGNSSPDIYSSPTRRNRNFVKPTFFEEFVVQKPSISATPVYNASESINDAKDQKLDNEHIVEQAFAKVVESEALVLNFDEDIGTKEIQGVTRDQDVRIISKDQGSNNESTVKPLVKKSFNFRTNKTRIESILKKDDSFFGKYHMQVDFNTENQPIVNSLLESTLNSSSNQTLRETNEDKNLTMKSETILMPEEKTQVKSRGFNFKNPKRIIIENSASLLNSPSSQDAELSVETNEAISTKSPVAGESNKEVKRIRGFNFRNPAKAKAE